MLSGRRTSAEDAPANKTLRFCTFEASPSTTSAPRARELVQSSRMLEYSNLFAGFKQQVGDLPSYVPRCTHDRYHYYLLWYPT